MNYNYIQHGQISKTIHKEKVASQKRKEYEKLKAKIIYYIMIYNKLY